MMLLSGIVVCNDYGDDAYGNDDDENDHDS